MDDQQDDRDELRARWALGESLTEEEKRSLAQAAFDDAALRAALVRDQRVSGMLRALGRASVDQDVFAKRFVARVAAERNGGKFVATVKRRIEHPSGPTRTPTANRWRFAWLVPAFGLAAAAMLLFRPGAGPKSVRIVEEPVAVVQAPSPIVAAVQPSAPGRPGSARPGHIQEVTGSAVLVSGRGRNPALAGNGIEAGEALVTVGPDSAATVMHSGGARLRLGASTVLTLFGAAAAADAVEGNVTEATAQGFLTRGTLAVEGFPAVFALVSPHATVRAEGRRYTITVAEKSTRVEVLDGRAQITGMQGARPTTVTSRQEAFVVEGDVGAGIKAVASVTVSRNDAAVVFLVGKLALTPLEQEVKKRIEALGLPVQARRELKAAEVDLAAVKLVIISNTVHSPNVNAAQLGLAGVPILTWEPTTYGELGMTGTNKQPDCGWQTGDGDLVIKTPGHPLAAGLSKTVVVMKTVIAWPYGVPGLYAQWIAIHPRRPTQAMIFGYEKGVPMPGLAAAPARRVAFFFHGGAVADVTEQGWALFDAAARWCTE